MIAHLAEISRGYGKFDGLAELIFSFGKTPREMCAIAFGFSTVVINLWENAGDTISELVLAIKGLPDDEERAGSGALICSKICNELEGRWA